MIRDDDIRQGLSAAGIPAVAMSTTLPKEGAPQLRQLIVEGVLRPPRGVFLYPKSKTKASAARTLFYLVAKELFLSGVSVYCIPLSRLVSLLSNYDSEDENAAAMVDRVRAVFVLDFFEDGAPFPLQAWEAAKLRSWIRARVEAGVSVSFLSDSSPDRCGLWWPSSFMGYVCDSTTTQGVDA